MSNHYKMLYEDRLELRRKYKEKENEMTLEEYRAELDKDRSPEEKALWKERGNLLEEWRSLDKCDDDKEYFKLMREADNKYINKKLERIALLRIELSIITLTRAIQTINKEGK